MLSKKLSSGADGAPIDIRPVPQRQILVATVVEQLAHQVRSGAIVAGNADAAVRAMRSHLEAGQERLLFRAT